MNLAPATAAEAAIGSPIPLYPNIGLKIQAGSAPFNIMQHAGTLAATILHPNSSDQVSKNYEIRSSQNTCRLKIIVISQPRVYVPSYLRYDWQELRRGSMYRPHQGNPVRKKDDDKPGDSTRALAIVVGIIISFVGAFLVGQGMAEYKEMKRENSPLKREIQEWRNVEKNYNPNVQKFTNKLIEKMESIISRKKGNLAIHIAFSVALVASGILLVAGGVAASYALLGVGAVGLVTALAVKIGKLVYDHHYKGNETDANSLKYCLEDFPREEMDDTILIQPQPNVHVNPEVVEL